MILPVVPTLQEPAPTPDPALLLEKARALRAQKRWAEAVEIYTQMLGIWKDHRLALFDRAQTLSWMKCFDESIRDFKRHREVYPEFAAESEPALARVTAWSRRFKEAVRILEPYVIKGDRQAILDTATFLSWDGQLRKSLALTDAWLKAHPEDRDFLILRGRVLGWSGKHGEARNAYQKVLAQSPGDRDAILGQAQLDLWSGNPEGADHQLSRLNQVDARGPEAELMRSQIDQRTGRLRSAKRRVASLMENLEVREDVLSRFRDLADAQGPWAELSQTRTDSNEGLRAQSQRVDAAIPILDGNLRVGGSLDLLNQAGQSERRPREWSLGLNHPLGSRVNLGAQAGRVDEVGGSPASFHSISLGIRPAPGLHFALSQTFSPNLATPRAVDLRTFTRAWGLGGSWVFNQTLDHVALTLERAFLSAGPMKSSLRFEAGHRFPFEGGEWRGGLSSRLTDQDQSLNLGFFNPQRYRYYGATVGASLSREEHWEITLDSWGGRQLVNQASSQFSWGYTLAGNWTLGRSPLSLFASWSQSVAGLPVSDPIDPSAYRDHTLVFGLRVRGNRWN